MLLVVGSLLSLSDQYSLFNFNQELYGELVGHLKVTLLYLAMSELAICSYCLFSKKTKVFIVVGFFLILMIGSLHFYSQINDVEIDENLSLFFLYTGISHICFGIVADLKKKVHGLLE
jgi:FtsH-binding integral membrane protein